MNQPVYTLFLTLPFFVNDLNGYYFSFTDSADTLAGVVRIADIFFRHASEGLYLHAASLKKMAKRSCCQTILALEKAPSQPG